jgi:signal transduction histidine kinase
VRRRLVLAIAAVAAASVVLFAIPLAFAIRQSYRDAELLRLQRDAVAATRQIDLVPAPNDAIELPQSTDAIGVYAPDGSRRAGKGPARADGAVAAALASGRPTSAGVGGRLVAAVPLIVRERVTGVVRVSRDAAAVAGRVRRAWLALAGLAGLVMLAAVAAAMIVGRRMARPLERLADTAGRLGEGDFTISPPPVGIAEIDAVATSLTATARRLGDLVARERSFSAHASHQLRTPLSALRLDIESMQLRSGAPAEVPLALEQVDRLQVTVETLLAVARGAPPRRRGLDLVDITTEVEARWRAPLADAARPLRIRIESPPPAAAGSREVVLEILAVLMENALVHGAGVVSVTVRRTSPGWAAIEVADEGIGIPAAAGDLFVRRDGGGHGIGLALARSLAEAEGARLDLAQRGPTPVFVLYLPEPAYETREPRTPEPVHRVRRAFAWRTR